MDRQQLLQRDHTPAAQQQFIQPHQASPILVATPAWDLINWQSNVWRNKSQVVTLPGGRTQLVDLINRQSNGWTKGQAKVFISPGSRAPACRSHQSAQRGCWSGWSSGTAHSVRAGRTRGRAWWAGAQPGTRWEDQRAGCSVYHFPARSITRNLPQTLHAVCVIHCTQAISPAPSFLAWLQRTCGGGLHQERRDSMGRSQTRLQHGTHACALLHTTTRHPPAHACSSRAGQAKQHTCKQERPTLDLS